MEENKENPTQQEKEQTLLDVVFGTQRTISRMSFLRMARRDLFRKEVCQALANVEGGGTK